MFALLSFILAAPLLTTAEQSSFTTTGRYQEVEALCAGFAQKYPGRVRCFDFGTTPEGRKMKALALSQDGVLDSKSAKQKQRPVLFVEGGIHAGEIDGKDAGFWLLPDLLDGKVAAGALGRVTLLFVPVFNVDGHERFGKNHRPNQRGPEEMGWRTTAQNLNLNRDWSKADAPEMRAMLKLINEWDPAVLVDLHVTDGAKFQHDVAVLVEPILAGPVPLFGVAKALSQQLHADLRKGGHLSIDRFYPAFEKDDDPSSGFAMGVAPPRLSSPYWALRNRIGILVETHAWKPYKERVKATRDVLEALLAHADDARAWRDAGLAIDEQGRASAGRRFVLAWDNDDSKEKIDFLGYHYERVASEVSGATWTKYDETKPEVWKVPLLTGVKPIASATAPQAGYVVPAPYAGVIGERLALHGIRFSTIGKSQSVSADVYKATSADFGAKSYEGHQTLRVKGAWERRERAIEKGAIFVPVNQDRARLLVHLLEPEAPDSYLAWGFFNASFEQKEYMEPYVAEEEARKMLAASSALKAEFEKKLFDDTKFRNDPEARLDFFYRRHPTWDQRLGEYPVLRVDIAP